MPEPATGALVPSGGHGADRTSRVTLPDGSTREVDRGTTAADVAASIGKRLAKDALAAKVDGEWSTSTRRSSTTLASRSSSPRSDDGREVLRHSTAHVMAQAVTDLFPGARYAIGPAIDDGFYYDFELPDGAHFSDDDLERIEARMREIVAADQPFVRDEVDRDDGLARVRRPAVQARDHREGRRVRGRRRAR